MTCEKTSCLVCALNSKYCPAYFIYYYFLNSLDDMLITASFYFYCDSSYFFYFFVGELAYVLFGFLDYWY